MNKIKRILYALLFFIIIFISCIGIIIYRNNNSKQTLTVGIYTGSSWDVPNGNQYHMIQYEINKFKKIHPNVKIVYESGIKKSDYINWLSKKIVTGQTPDVIMISPEYFNLFASEQTFKNISGYVKKEKLSSVFYKGSLEAEKFQGKQYAIPYETNPTLLIANQRILKKEKVGSLNKINKIKIFQNICHYISKKKGFYGITSNYDWLDAQLAYRTNLFSGNNHELQLISNQARKGFNLIQDISNENKEHNVTNEEFDQGKVAFMPLNFAQYRTYTSYPYHVTQNTNFHWQVLKMPGRKSTPSATVGFGISSQSRKTKLAWEFIKLLCSNQDIQQELMKTQMGCSVMPKVIMSKQTKEILKKDNSLKDSMSSNKLNNILRDEAILPKFKNYNQVMSRLDYQINQSLMQGNLDSQLFNIQLNINRN